MFVVFLRFSERKDQAARFMEAHKAWLARGFEEGAFLLSGGLAGGAGGAILARRENPAALRDRIAADPFVAEGVVVAEIVEIAASRADPRLDFLLARP